MRLPCQPATHGVVPRRRVCCGALLLAAAALLITVVLAAPARAGTINVWACHQPNGQWAPLDRWSSYINAAAIDNWNTCNNGGVGSFGTNIWATFHPGHSYGSWTFTAPANTTVTGFTYDRGGSVTGGASLNIFNGTEPIYDSPHLEELCQAANGCGGLSWARINVGPVPNANGFMFLTESCYIVSGCDGNSNGSFTVGTAIVELSDIVPPAFSGLTGSLTGSNVLSGNASLNFLATDAGTGVYKVHAKVDGVSFDDRVVDANGGACAALSGPRDFMYAVPCKLNSSVGSTLNTATLADGVHNIDVKIEDAAGNLTTVLSNDVTTRNSPVSTGVPEISGSPRVGERQTGTNGTWSPVATSYRYQWLRCPSSVTSAAQSGSCASIVGGTVSQYDATTFDAYQRLMLRVTATNAGGSVTAISQPTDVIADAQGRTSPPPGDSDGDGVADSSDGCPTQAGPASNNGCPVQPPSAPPSAPSSDPVSPVVRSGGDGGSSAAGCNPVCGGSYRNAVITGSSTTRRSKAGQGFAMSLVLKLPDGKPVSGALLQIVEKVSRPGAKEQVVATVKTAADGKAVYRSPTRMVPSAVYSATYSAQLPSSTAAVASTSYDAIFRVTHTVASRVTFASSPRRARNGSVLRLAGQVKATLFPKRGLTIRYEAQRAGGKGAGRARWTQFHATRTKSTGRYSSRYQLRGNNLPSKLTMRACVEKDSGWPYQNACSRSYTIKVRR